jgi:hypothetical protein
MSLFRPYQEQPWDEKISLNVSALLVNPACQGLTKLYKSSTQNS